MLSSRAGQEGKFLESTKDQYDVHGCRHISAVLIGFILYCFVYFYLLNGSRENLAISIEVIMTSIAIITAITTDKIKRNSDLRRYGEAFELSNVPQTA